MKFITVLPIWFTFSTAAIAVAGHSLLDFPALSLPLALLILTKSALLYQAI